MAGLPLSKGRPLYLVTKHTKFNYSGKGELCFQHRKVIHMRWTPLLFCFPQCFHYDGSFLSFGWGEVTNMPLLDPVSFSSMCFLCSFSWAHNMFISLLVLEVQTSFLQQLVWQAFLPLMLCFPNSLPVFMVDLIVQAVLCISSQAVRWCSSEAATFSCGLLVFLCVRCEECYLNRTCQTQWTNLELWATIVFFFPSTHLHNSYSKRKKNGVDDTRSARLFCTFLCFTASRSFFTNCERWERRENSLFAVIQQLVMCL